MNGETHGKEQAVSNLPPPRRRGLSIGWRLALSTAFIVTVVMGSMTLLQHIYEIRSDRSAREQQMQQALAPLMAEIENAADLEDILASVASFHKAYLRNGRPDHQMVLRDFEGKVVVSTEAGNGPAYHPSFRVVVPVASGVLEGGKGSLEVVEDATQFENQVAQGWKLWWVHMGVTIGSILLFLLPAIRFLVTRPLSRLLDGVRKMEMGYWGDLSIPSGAWEIRWLCWRFRCMGLELQRTVEHLVAAERRAFRPPGSSDHGEDLNPATVKPEVAAIEHPALSSDYARLEAKAIALEAMKDGGAAGAVMARKAWHHDAIEADRLGAAAVKVRLENAALRILHPEAFLDLEKALAAMKRSKSGWLKEREDEIRKAIEARSLSLIEVRHRIKHVASVWKKMRSKGLELEQVHDLIAFRIEVSRETDCYSALGVIHQNYEPIVGRFKDYIAAPKDNGYQSLHTCVRTDDGTVFEVQIRTTAMHLQSESGKASHWAYKEAQPENVSEGFPVRAFWKSLVSGFSRD
ncbi:MAG: bifunctional (p)ppGpp synthetase/guanosine-3',5'-bis(diphosphate) 3'-pyrophosphohydrolase [Deltaproteobacteria bacterium]|nr:bifunctional (p)ppGpp synthetase/guanosine-3',5'-bis(diphosphate) 3'-pyrophosphohydrolase [Deltaproteobacteria bacterium]